MCPLNAKSISSLSMLSILLLSIIPLSNIVYAAYTKAPPSATGPTINDSGLKVETVAKGLKYPTSMAFLGSNDILVLEKNIGKVVRIVNGKMLSKPVLDVNVATNIERGMLGIAIAKHENGPTHVFLYYTESGGGTDGDDFTSGITPLGNRLYRYELVDNQLVNPKLLLDLPTTPPDPAHENNHMGGKVAIGPDQNVYMIIGEVGGHVSQAENVKGGPPPDGTGGILRVTQDGQPVENSPLGDSLPLNVYYAYGIRNSFGMDFDPVTGTLWDTENGPAAGDEINMVRPGFNSGWSLIQGLAEKNIMRTGATPNDLVKIGSSQYKDPAFSWMVPIGITDLKFLNSAILGKQYENNMFVGDIDNGNLYRFTLNANRDAISLNSNDYRGELSNLQDTVVDTPGESAPVMFGQGFGGITDLDVGPDGYLYVLTFQGDLYRILPASASSEPILSKSQPELQNPQTPSSSSESKSNAAANKVIANIVGVKGDQSYQPNPISIKRGQTVTWLNGDVVSHTV